MKWNPDPRWPRHIVQLCEALAEGEECQYALHDAFLEEGLPESAKSTLEPREGYDPIITPAGMIGETRLTRSVIAGIVLNDGYLCSDTWGEMKEIKAYLARRGPAPSVSASPPPARP